MIYIVYCVRCKKNRQIEVEDKSQIKCPKCGTREAMYREVVN